MSFVVKFIFIIVLFVGGAVFTLGDIEICENIGDRSTQHHQQIIFLKIMKSTTI